MLACFRQPLAQFRGQTLGATASGEVFPQAGMRRLGGEVDAAVATREEQRPRLRGILMFMVVQSSSPSAATTGC